ncbi:DNRLRE domain-containing protein [Nonomuraea endophytica]|uniref:DNRLRE domain-containing protein n=1 Tax=Nonomuraea endophytica TaxID=714136 RepID=A0A7W8A340_9ACTN|nr:DNRLRE domain-containing protein [Nonomuraea endophytica]MBB5077508.1 hypothetical protein [Nonomuraea endophytica]
MTGPAQAQEPPPSAPSAAPSENPTATAFAQARKTDQRVEIEALRSETSTYFANPNGKTVQAEVSSTPIRAKKDGIWQPIDTTLVEQGGVVRPKVGLGDLTLSAGGDSTAASYTDTAGRTAIAAPATLAEPVLKDNTATYRDAYGPGADLVVTVTPSGFRHDVVIRQRPAKGLELRTPLRLPKGLKLGTGSDRTPGLLDAKGKEVADLAAAPMMDAAALAAPDQGAIGQAEAKIAGDSVVHTASAAFLNDPATVYPVTVTTLSETWEGTGIAGDTHVSNVLPSGSANATLPWLLAGKSHSGTRTHRTYINFHISGTPLEGGTVHNADLRLHNQDSHTCSDTDSPGIDLQRVTSPWSTGTISWNNQPSTVLSGHVANRGAYSATRCPEGEGELYYSIELIVQAWMNGTPDLGVRLNSVIEPDSPQNWRYYRSDEYGGYDTYPFTPRGPVLFIEYTPAPVTELNAVGWFFDDEPGLEGRQNIQAVIDDPELGRATSSQPAVEDLTDEQALDAREQDGEQFEVPPDFTGEDPDVDPVEPTPTPEPDTTPPVVNTTLPLPDATDTPVDSPVRVQFSEPVHDVVLQVKGPGGTPVAGTTTSSPESDTWTFTASAPLSPQTGYTAAAGGAADNAGNTIAAPHTWSFTTGTETSQPTTVSLPVRDDTWIDDENSQGPTGATLWTGRYQEINERTYLDFDTGALTGKRVTGATLKLRNNSTYGCGTAASGIVAQRVVSSWSPATLTWGNKPSATAEGQATARDPETCTGSSSGAIWTWDVTAIVQSWAGGQANHGFVLQGADESPTAPLYDRGFDSAEADAADAEPPILEVTYTGGSGPTPTDPPGPDTTPPTVLSTDPENDATGVPADAQVKATFSEAVRDVRFSLYDLFSEEPVTGRAGMSSDGKQFTFTPSSTLDGYYLAEITQAEDTAGNAMAAYSWVFETFSPPAPNSRATARADGPKVSRTWGKPSGTGFSQTRTPHLIAVPDDPLRRRPAVRFEVAHDPSAPAQGRGLIWSGTDTGVSSGRPGMVRVPEGRLHDGWKVRWRARASVDGTSSPWSAWQNMTVGKQRSPVAKTTSAAAIPPVGDTPPPKAAGIYDRITTQDCYNNQALAGRVKGWIKNHFSWCQIGKVEAVQERYQGTSGQGPPLTQDYYKAKVMLIGYTFTGKTAAARSKVEPRDILVEAYVYDQRTYGTMPLNHTMVLGMDIGNKPYCTHVSTWNGTPVSNHKSLTVSGWKLDGRATFRFRCSGDPHSVNRTVRWGPDAHHKVSIPNAEKVTFGSLKAYANFPTWPGVAYRYVSNADRSGIGGYVRCDSASYVRYKGGCIFHKATSWVKLHWDKGYNEAFNHYWNACKRPGTETYPTKSDKKIAGCGHPEIPPAENVLHREYQNIRDTNQGNTNRTCNRMWPGYSGNDKECDEYPFASTRERTNARTEGTGMLSLCPVDKRDNGAAGRLMETHYYSKDRILVGDTFTISFDETGMGTQLGKAALCGVPVRDP